MTSRMRSSVGPNFQYRDAEGADGVCREGDLDHQQVVGEEETGARGAAHVPAQRQPGDQKKNPDDVEDVIDIEPVSRPLVMAHARERAIEAVAEPVHREQGNCSEKARR